MQQVCSIAVVVTATVYCWMVPAVLEIGKVDSQYEYTIRAGYENGTVNSSSECY